MTVPLIILAAFAILLSFIGTPAWPWFEEFLNGHPAHVEFNRLFQPDILRIMLVSAAIVFAGIGLGYWLYGRKATPASEEPDVLARWQPDVFALLSHKYFVDEFYELTFVRLNAWWARSCDWLDFWIWNGLVQIVSFGIIGISWVSRVFDEYVINLGFDQGCRRVTEGAGLMSLLQNGRVQNWLRVIGVALCVLVLFLMWGRRAS